MQINGDYHTHTRYSHGKHSIEENIQAARKLGLDTIAITDHGPGHVFYGVSEEKLLEMKEKIKAYNSKYKDIDILFGVEANFIDFEGNIDLSDYIINQLDFIAVGFHSGIIPKGVKSKFIFSFLGNLLKVHKKTRNRLRDLANEAMIKSTYKYKIKFITHPGSKFGVDLVKLAKNMNPNTMIEINNKHKDLSPEVLKNIKDLNIKFIINSDAHNKDDVGKVDQALEIVKQAKIPASQIYNIR